MPKTLRNKLRMNKSIKIGKTMKKGNKSGIAGLAKLVIPKFLEMINTIKIYHWKTSSYSTHKATDDLFGNLNTKTDEFVEVMLGKLPSRPNLHLKSIPLRSFTNISSFLKEIDKCKKFLIQIHYSSNNSDLLNIRDEILGNLNKFTYLLSFK